MTALCLPNVPRPAAFATARAHSLFTMSDIRSERAQGAGFATKLFDPDDPSTLPRSAGEGGGAGRDRTDDLMLAKHALSQLSYVPDGCTSEPKARKAEWPSALMRGAA